MAAQVVQVTDAGYVSGIAFIQSSGRIGTFSAVDYDVQWTGDLFDSIADAEAALTGKSA